MPKKTKISAIPYKTSKQRSRIMSKIRSSNTKPEIIVRKLLFRNGYRYRLYYKKLPGSPDIALTKYKVAIFVQGCFWHYHGCHISHMPKNNTEFWQKKIKRNLDRDKRTVGALTTMGWRVLLIWECALITKSKLEEKVLIGEIMHFVNSSTQAHAIAGKQLQNKRL